MLVVVGIWALMLNAVHFMVSSHAMLVIQWNPSISCVRFVWHTREWSNPRSICQSSTFFCIRRTQNVFSMEKRLARPTDSINSGPDTERKSADYMHRIRKVTCSHIQHINRTTNATFVVVANTHYFPQCTHTHTHTILNCYRLFRIFPLGIIYLQYVSSAQSLVWFIFTNRRHRSLSSFVLLLLLSVCLRRSGHTNVAGTGEKYWMSRHRIGITNTFKMSEVVRLHSMHSYTITFRTKIYSPPNIRWAYSRRREKTTNKHTRRWRKRKKLAPKENQMWQRYRAFNG